MNFLINTIGLLIIDIGAIIYGKLGTRNLKVSILFLLTNIIGGLLYKYK